MAMLYRRAPHPLANGVTIRPVPGPLAPDRCVTHSECVSPEHVLLVGRDLDGVVRVKVELHREDVSSWWVKVLRHWLAWRYSATELKVVGG